MAAPRAYIVVTAMRKATVAQAEDLGDLKLFRLALPTTIAPRAQKQVALFAPRSIELEVLHTAALDDFDGQGPARLTVRTRNDTANGLGLALPGGSVRILAEHAGQALIAGQGRLDDRAINDRLEIAIASSSQVTVEQHVTHRARTARSVAVTVSNANRFAVQFVGTFRQTPAGSIRNASSPLGIEDGHRLWAVRVPAHGRVTLRYRIARG